MIKKQRYRIIEFVTGILLFICLGVLEGCYPTQQVAVDRIITIDSVRITALTRKDRTKIEYPGKQRVYCKLRNDTLITYNTNDTLLREPLSEFLFMEYYLTQVEKDKHVIDIYRSIELIQLISLVIGGALTTIFLLALLLN